jgi:16S rRNA (uracil1498-N3)-methyltransferase
MSERFFVAEPITGQQATLTGDEARHLSTVMRLAVGNEVTLFDGSGPEFTARISAIGKHRVQLDITERRDISRELPCDLSLAVALPKGDRQKWLVEKTTELGVTRLIPLITERGIAQPVESALDRLRRGVIEASKQCGRNRLMEIAEPERATDLFGNPALVGWRLLAHPVGRPVSELRLEQIGGHSPPYPLLAAIGPEGGFTESEIAAALSAGWQPISLGSRILRVETAAIALASLLPVLE